jgi:hypothetical protein
MESNLIINAKVTEKREAGPWQEYGQKEWIAYFQSVGANEALSIWLANETIGFPE